MPALQVNYTAVPIEPEPVASHNVLRQKKAESCAFTTYSNASGTADLCHDSWREDIRRGRLNSELLTAVQNGDLKTTTRLLDEGASVNATCRPSGTTALQLATELNDINFVQLMLARRPNVKRRDRAGRQAVHFAAAGGYDLILGILLEADPSQVDSQICVDKTHLRRLSDSYEHDSWSHDHDSVSSLFPELSGGSTPLHLATQRGHDKCVDILLSYKAKVSITDDRGLTPLDVSGEISTSTPADDDPELDQNRRSQDKVRDWIAKYESSDVPNGDDNNTTREDSSATPSAARSTTSEPTLSEAAQPETIPNGNAEPSSWYQRFKQIIFRRKQKPKTTMSQPRLGSRYRYSGRRNDSNQAIKRGPSVLPLPTTPISTERTRFGRDTSSDESSDLPPPYESPTPTVPTNQTRLGKSKSLEEPVVSSAEPLPTNSIQRIVNALISKGATIPRSKLNLKRGSVVKQLTMPVTCLHTAVESGDSVLVKFLLKNGACPITWNKSGMTAIHLAVAKHMMEPLQALLEWDKSPAVVDARDSEGRTPLHVAVTEEWASGVSILLEAGADVKATSNDNQTVLHLAVKNGNSELLRELLSIPESAKIMDFHDKSYSTPLCCAVSAGQITCANLLLEHGADSTTILPGHVTLLHIAAQKGNDKMLKILIRDTKAIDSLKDIRSTQGRGGMTPLHLACWKGHVECVKLLVSIGSDLYAKTTESPHFEATPLHLAARQGYEEVIEYILSCDKRTLNTKNRDNWYPLHIAAKHAKKDSIKVMLKHGANLAATVTENGYRKTALDMIALSVADPASFFDEIFDHFIQFNKHPLNHPKCLIKVHYNLLTPLGEDKKQLRVLDALLNCNKQRIQEKLLQHPLVETFLFLKWMRLRVFFFFIIALYLTFTLSLTIMALFTYVFKTEDIVAVSTVASCRIITLVSLVVIIIKELLHASRLQRYYITDLESWVKWSAFLTGAVVVGSNHNIWWLIHVTSVAVLLAWLELLFLLSRCPSAIGFYVLMFFTVANKVVKVMATFIFVILGFTFAFLIHFQGQSPFSNLWEALVKVIVMTTEFNYSEMFEMFPGITPASVIGRSIFIAFVILVSIVLMNLLIGLAVSDIATLEAEGRKQRLAKQIDFLSLLEIFVYNRNFFSFLPQSLCSVVKTQRAVFPLIAIQPDKPNHGLNQMLPHHLQLSVITNVVNQKKNEEELRRTEFNSKIGQVSQMTETVITHQNMFKSLPVRNAILKRSGIMDRETKTVLEKILAELETIKNKSVNFYC